MSEWKSLCISFISQESFLDGPMWQKLLLKMAAGKENMICLLSPLSVKVSQNENHHRSAPREIKVALYYVKFSVTGWKLISTLNNCADLQFLEQQTQHSVRPVESGEKVEQTFPQNPGQCFAPLPSVVFFPFFFLFSKCQWCSMIRSLFEPSRGPHTNTFFLIGVFKGWEWVGKRWKKEGR